MSLLFNFSFLIPFLVLLPALCLSEDPFTSSRATYYGSPDCLGTPRANGLGEFGRNVNGGNVGAVAKLYRSGTGCGAWYQIRCTQSKLCTEDGVKIVVTDHGEGDNTDFILSARGFGKLARPNMASQLMAYGVIDMEYKRISCQYPGYNLMFKVDENSRFPDYLAIVVIHQAGQKDITAVELWEEDCQQWVPMHRAFGAVWGMANPPKGPLNLQFQISGYDGQKWVQLRDVIPIDWKEWVAYDSVMQLY